MLPEPNPRPMVLHRNPNSPHFEALRGLLPEERAAAVHGELGCCPGVTEGAAGAATVLAMTPTERLATLRHMSDGYLSTELVSHVDRLAVGRCRCARQAVHAVMSSMVTSEVQSLPHQYSI